MQNNLNKEWEQNSNRVRDVNFANHERNSASIVSSRKAVFDKVFDEGGYISFRLNSVEKFKTTYIRNIMEQNPEIYFTDDIVTADDISYEEWAYACDTPPGQIFVDQNLKDVESPNLRLSAAVIRQEDLELIREGDLISLEGNLCAGDEKTGRVRVYLNDLQEDNLPLALLFVENEERSHAYSGEFHVNRTEEGTYVDIFFPDIEKVYAGLQITCSMPDAITGAQIVFTERMTKDSYVDVSYFGFNDNVMTVNAPSEGYVTILQVKHDGWSAYVDGDFFIGAALTGLYIIFLMILKIRILLKRGGE